MGARWRQTGSPATRSFPLPLADCLLAGFLFVAFEFADRFYPTYVSTAPHLVWAGVGAVMTLSVALRRRQPLGVWVVTIAGAALLLAFIAQLDPFASVSGWPSSPLVVLPAPLVALYTLVSANQARGRLAFAGSAIVLGLMLFGPFPAWRPVHVYENGPPGLTPLRHEDPKLLALLAAGALITAWALGETARARRESADVRRLAAEAEKAEHDRAVAAEERARIARELHDITAHHISVVTLQAGAARLLAESGRAPSAALLRGIETASRQAMIEIRQALGVIRSTPDGAAPLPGLAKLPELAAQMGLAGLTVTIDGRAGTLPGGLDLTAYRIVQEGLTNIARHSAARTARVELSRARGTLQITVADGGPARGGPATGPAAPAGPGGHGLIGLRERVARYGGQLSAGPRPGGGFVLRATLPVRDPADDDWLPETTGQTSDQPATGQPATPLPATSLQPRANPALSEGR
jgi:signal transduction histidine kinase